MFENNFCGELEQRWPSSRVCREYRYSVFLVQFSTSVYRAFDGIKPREFTKNECATGVSS
jgi:hypothetical protein